MLTIDDLWRIMKYLKDGTTDPNLSELTTTLATSEKEIVIQYFEQIIDQDTFKTDDMKRLREMLIDWYSSHKTIATTQRYSSDVHQIPNQQLSELFRSFGFPYGLNLVPLTTKANFFLDLVNFYKKKGTPETLVDVLDYYGFSDTDLIEYWLQKDEYGNLIFRGESVRLAASGSTLLLDSDVPFEKLTDGDPHWLQSKDKIESLLQTNKINLPSKSPYYSLSSIFSLYNITISLSILFRIVEDQYDRFMSGLELPYNTPIKNLGTVVPILHVYIATIYTFEKMFGYGVFTNFTNYNCYDGDVEYLGTPPVPYNLSNITKIYEDLISRPISRDDRTTRIQTIVDDWSRPMSQNFLNSINASEPLLDALNPEFKTIIDTWFDTGDESFLITYLIGTLDNWIRLNIDSKSPSLVITMLGLGFRKELYDILNFFKPYRARLAFMDTAFSFKNPLTESILLDEKVLTEIGSFYHDSIRPPGFPCNQTQAEIDLEHLMDMTWQWDTGRFFDDPPIVPTLPPTKDPFPPALCNNLEWLYDIGRRYNIPMPPEYLNFSYDSGGYYDILPILQKCLLEALKKHPGGGICDSVITEIGLFFHDKIARNYTFNSNWDTGAFFDSGFEEQWLDKLEITNDEQPEGDIVPIDDDGSNHQIEQNFTDNINLSDSFYIVISYVGDAIITSNVGKYPTAFDTGNVYDSLTNLDVSTDGRIFEWLSSTISIQSLVEESIGGLDVGIIEEMTATAHVSSSITIDIGIIEKLTSTVYVSSTSTVDISLGGPDELSSSILVTSLTVSDIYVGTYSGTVSAESNVFDTDLTLGLAAELSANIYITTEIQPNLTAGAIGLSSSVSINTVYATSTLLHTGLTEDLSVTCYTHNEPIVPDIILASSQLYADLTSINSVYNARSIIIDIENNHGDPVNVGLMGIRFARFGNIIDIGIPGTDYDAFATTTLEPGTYAPWRAFYNISPLTGTVQNWMSKNQTTNQRLVCTIGIGINLDEIIFYNYHASGTDTDKGIKNVKVYLSTDIISETVYGQPISNGELIFDGIIDEHSGINEEDPQSITIGVYTGSSHSTTNVYADFDGGILTELMTSICSISTSCNATLDSGDQEELEASTSIISSCFASFEKIDEILTSSISFSTDCVATIIDLNEILIGSINISTELVCIIDIGLESELSGNSYIESVTSSNLDIQAIESLSSSCIAVSSVSSTIVKDINEILSSSTSISSVSNSDLNITIIIILSSITNITTDIIVELIVGDDEELSGSSDNIITSIDADLGFDFDISGTTNVISSCDADLGFGDNEELSSTTTTSTFAFTTILTTGITEVLTSTSTSTSESDSDLTIV